MFYLERIDGIALLSDDAHAIRPVNYCLVTEVSRYEMDFAPLKCNLLPRDGQESESSPHPLPFG